MEKSAYHKNVSCVTPEVNVTYQLYWYIKNKKKLKEALALNFHI